MKAQINLITIWTNDMIAMKRFYTDVLGFETMNDLGNYIELKNDGVRFSLCERKVMADFSEAYKINAVGQSFELGFACSSPEEVNETYTNLIALGAKAIKEPQNMPWNQRTALFADPDGNIHEIFSEL